MAGNNAEKMTPAQCPEVRGLWGLKQEGSRSMAKQSQGLSAHRAVGLLVGSYPKKS
jgi:hypothetical protein